MMEMVSTVCGRLQVWVVEACSALSCPCGTHPDHVYRLVVLVCWLLE